MNYTKLSRSTIFVIIGITLFFGYHLSQIRFDFSMRNFYPVNHPETEFFYEYGKEFEWDDDYVLIGIESPNGIFNHQFLKEVDALSKALKELPEITQVVSPTSLEIFRYVPYMDVITNTPLIHLEEPERIPQDSSIVYNRKELVSRLFSPDGQSVAIMLRQSPNLEYEDCALLVDKLDKLVQPFQNFKKVHFAGKCYGQTTFVDLSKKEIGTFVGLSFLIIAISLFVSYRRFSAIWMPSVVVGTTVVWTIGTMMFLGQPLDFISNITPTVILIIGISNIIHLFTKYLMELQNGQPKMDALKTAIKKVGTATIFTSFTTIVGFMTLLFSSVQPLINLGGFASLGLVYAFILTYTLFPAMLVLYKPSFNIKTGAKTDFWNDRLAKLFNWTMQNKIAIIIGSVILLGIGTFGALKLRVNQRILEDIAENHPQMVHSRYFENEFSGSRQFEMQIKLKDTTKSVLDLAVLQELETVENYLQQVYGIGAIFSPVGIIKEANRIQHSGNNDYYRLPKDEKELKKAQKLVDRYLKDSNYPKVFNEQGNIGRFSGKIGDIGSYPIRQKNEALAEFMNSPQRANLLEYHQTGSAYLMDINNLNIASNVFYGLLFSFAIIGLIIGLLFRSLKMAVLALVPNVLPLLFIAGIMGFIGIDLKISTSILFIISFGIAVDDSIHFMSTFKFEQGKKVGIIEALRNTYLSTGKAIVVTSLILSSGFSTLCFSTFKGTLHIGIFTSLCLLTALLADLLLLPVLLYYTSSKKEKALSKEVAEKIEESVMSAN